MDGRRREGGMNWMVDGGERVESRGGGRVCYLIC